MHIEHLNRGELLQHGPRGQAGGQIAPASAQAFGEGLQSLLPSLRAYPQAFGGLAGALLESYLGACEQSSQPPDAALVQAVKQARE